MSATAKTSRLQAVNSILSAAGEAPVASLATEAGLDSSLSQQILDESCTAVQTMGWSWNTGDVTFVPTGANSEYLVPANYIRLDDGGGRGCHFTIRSGRIFDTVNRTSTGFTANLRLTVVELLSWDDLPEAARQYITARAGRIFVDRTLNDPALTRAARATEFEALTLLRHHETDSSNMTICAPELEHILRETSVVDRFF